MQRSGMNQGGYFGEQIPICDVLEETVRSAARSGWQVTRKDFGAQLPLFFLTRPARRNAASDGALRPVRLYLSTGIHGDEPAGPLALQGLIRDSVLPEDWEIHACPCLNPGGCQTSSRLNPDGIDLNRDYRHVRTPEVSTHIRWLETLPFLDLTLLLHEDWEASGFYLYEVNLTGKPSLAPQVIESVRPLCPIESAPEVDGRPLDAPGIIRPDIPPEERPEWPEAIWLVQKKTHLSYTLESPSDFPLNLRVRALRQAVETLIHHFH